VNAGDFTIVKTGGGQPVLGTDYTYNEITGVLTILKEEAYTIGMSPHLGGEPTTTHSIEVATDKKANTLITLDNMRIDLSGSDDACAFLAGNGVFARAQVHIFLKGDSILKSGNNCAGLKVSPYASATINSIDGTASRGSLLACSNGYGAGIGGNKGGFGYTITINGGTIAAYSAESVEAYGAGIGDGQDGTGTSSVTIKGGVVTATSSKESVGHGAGVGSGQNSNKDSTASVAINGGTITAYSSQANDGYGAGIGGGQKGITYTRVGIKGGSIIAKTSLSGEVSVTNPASGTTSSVPRYLVTIQLINPETLEPDAGALVSVTSGLSSYGVKDVVADGSGKLYFWLPKKDYASSVSLLETSTGTQYPGVIKVGGNNENTAILPNYTLALTAQFDGSPYTEHGKTFTLRDEEGKVLHAGAGADETIIFSGVAVGSYKLYDGNTNTNQEIAVSKDNTTATISYYSLTVVSGTIDQDDKGPYFEGAQIPVKADSVASTEFDGWTTTGTGTFADDASEETTFTMPAG